MDAPSRRGTTARINVPPSVFVLVMPEAFGGGHHGTAPHSYFEAAGAIIMFVLLGKLLETRARRRLVDAASLPGSRRARGASWTSRGERHMTATTALLPAWLTTARIRRASWVQQAHLPDATCAGPGRNFGTVWARSTLTLGETPPPYDRASQPPGRNHSQ